MSFQKELPPTRQVARKSTSKPPPPRNEALMRAYKRKNEECLQESQTSDDESLILGTRPERPSTSDQQSVQLFYRQQGRIDPYRQGGKDPYRQMYREMARNSTVNFRESAQATHLSSTAPSFGPAIKEPIPGTSRGLMAPTHTLNRSQTTNMNLPTPPASNGKQMIRIGAPQPESPNDSQVIRLDPSPPTASTGKQMIRLGPSPSEHTTGKQMIRLGPPPSEHTTGKQMIRLGPPPSEHTTGKQMIRLDPPPSEHTTGKQMIRLGPQPPEHTASDNERPSTSSGKGNNMQSVSLHNRSGKQIPQKRLNGKQMITMPRAPPPRQGEEIRFRASQRGRRAEKEIDYFRRSTGFLIPKHNFQRLVREVMQKYKTEYKINMEAVKNLQVASEQHIVEFFEKMNVAAVHTNRVTVQVSDSNLTKKVGRYEEKSNMEMEMATRKD